jgi:Domain of unknown function (DUF4386)
MSEGDEMAQVPPRVGGVAAVAGALALSLGTYLHPLDADPNDAPAAFAEYAANSSWVWTHLGQFFGVALILIGFVAARDAMEEERGAWIARLGLLFGMVALASAAALQAVDGVALKVMVNHWASAPPDQKQSAFMAAFAVRQIEVGMATFLQLLFGATMILYGAAMARSRVFPHWLGWLAAAGGLGMAAGGLLSGSTGFSPGEMTVAMPSSAVAVLWIIMVGVVLWRR